MKKPEAPAPPIHSSIHPEPSQPIAACLLLHGFTGTPWALEELATSLEQRWIVTEAPLLPGHGISVEALNNVAWTEWVEAAELALMRLKSQYEAVFVVGHSVGGALALYLASHHAVTGVIALSAPYRFRDWRLIFLPVLKHWVPEWRKRSRQHQNGDWQAEAGYDAYPLKGVAQCQQLLKAMRRRLRWVHAPALLMHSEKDYRIPVSDMDKIADSMATSAGVSVHRLPHAAHTITKGEDQGLVISTVQDFITGTVKK